MNDIRLLKVATTFQDAEVHKLGLVLCFPRTILFTWLNDLDNQSDLTFKSVL